MDQTPLNAPDRALRLEALRKAVAADHAAGNVPERSTETNNHVHTTYSFSPYSPSRMVYAAWRSGLSVVGSVDHDSVGAAGETLEAAAIAGIAATVGCEVRARFTGTVAESRRINSPDASGVAYMAIHAIPLSGLEEASRFLEPIRAAREDRTRAMTEAVNKATSGWGIEPLDYSRDVRSLSEAADGGTVTERHLLYALAGRLMDIVTPGPAMVAFLDDVVGAPPNGLARGWLEDGTNEFYRYDLLGALKSEFLSRVYLPPTEEECPDVREAIALSERVGGISAYAYLGDVEESPTGDKRREAFEDSYLDELVDELVRLGFRAITYMPPRNTREQLARISRLAQENGLMEISGVDINSARQSFRNESMMKSAFSHLGASAWALVAHEYLVSIDPSLGIFSAGSPVADLELSRRVERYARVGRQIEPSARTAQTEQLSEGDLDSSRGTAEALVNTLTEE